MKILIFFLAVTIALAGCSSEGEIRIINRTNHNLYFNVYGTDYILEGSTVDDPSWSITIDTGSQYLFFGNDETKVTLSLEGETFMMQDSDASGVPNGIFFTETTLTVKPRQTLNIYCDPTHAGVKLINNSQSAVTGFFYFTANSDSLFSLITPPLAPGDSTWSRLKATTEYDSVVYSFVIEYEGGIFDSSYVNIDDLTLDEQLRIELP